MSEAQTVAALKQQKRSTGAFLVSVLLGYLAREHNAEGATQVLAGIAHATSEESSPLGGLGKIGRLSMHSSAAHRFNLRCCQATNAQLGVLLLQHYQHLASV